MDLFKRDRELSRRVYELYISTDNKTEYIYAIKELSKETNVDETYLLRLLEEFYETFATEEEKAEIKKIRKRNSEKKYIKYVETIMKMSEEELKEYIKQLRLSDIKEFFAKYIKNATDKELIEKAEKILEKLIALYEKEKSNKKQEHRNQVYKIATKMLDKIVSGGYFSISQYKQEKYREYNLSEEQLYTQAKRYLDFLKKNYPKKYIYYIEEMEKNRLISFNILKPKIEEMFNNLPNNYDIIDYYLNIGMTPTLLKKLCNGLIEQEDEIKINYLFSKYNEINYPMAQIYSGIPENPKERATDETETKILKFMHEHKIPINFFFICYKKYRNGELDRYFHQKKKEF